MIFDISADCPIDGSIDDIFNKLYRVLLPLVSFIGLIKKLSSNFFTRLGSSIDILGPFKLLSKTKKHN